MPRWCAAILAVVALAGCDTDTEGGEARFRRPVNLIVPFGAGGGADQLARIAGPALEKQIGEQMPVVNVEGATGNTGITKMLSGRPGEQVAILIQDTLTTAALGSASFKPAELTGVCRLQYMPSALFAKAGRFASWRDVEAAARASPGELTVATVGQGSVDDIMIAELAERGVKLRGVPFADPSERYAALLGGEVDLLYEQPGDVRQQLQGGQFAPLLLFADEPLRGLGGNVTLAKDVGVRDVMPQFRGLVAPSDAPESIVRALGDACARLRTDRRVQAFQGKQFATADSFMDAARFSAFLEQQATATEKLLLRYGLKK